MSVVSQTVKDGLTKIEAAITQERTRNTFQSKTKRGKWFGGKAPYGYTYRVIEENNGGQKTRIEEFKGDKDQQEVVTEIYRLFEVLNSLNKFMRKLRWNNDFFKSYCIYFIN
ncbi:hypothetical protein [Bacillus toyonensis]|uniref:hypothetical protein n=1 Tax=Bacillus toyonensis TaxID=155322 RepID=UPI001CD25A9A|nr:hypothetical protein [Bacillus toyonensis]MCA1047814.1 hypothetical protein [Bacillus toyonensis]